MGERDVHNVTFALINRMRFIYTFKHIVFYILACLCLRRKAIKKKK